LKVDYVEETSVRKALAFEVEPEVVEKEIDSCAREYARKVRLPGFRAGKVPARVVRQRFRKAILDEAAENIVNRVVFDEIRGRGLKPVAQPRVTDLEIEEQKPFRFRAVFETLPLIDLPEWRGLEAKDAAPEPVDEALAAELKRLQEEAAQYEPVEDRPLEKGDHALLDAVRRPDRGDEQRNEDAVLEVGSEDNPPEVNEGLVGMTLGETRSVRVEPPAPPEGEQADEDRPGAEYTLTLKEIKRKVLPALDDEFAKDLGEFETLAELEASVRKRLEAAAARDADRAVKRALVDALVAKAEFELPEALVERHMSSLTENAARGLAMQGIDPTKLGIDWREYREKQRDDAERAARADLLLDEIARREGIEVSRAEVDAEVEQLAARLKRPKETLRAQMEKEGDLAALHARMREGRVLDLLKANAKLARG
jgi:trigger factor